MHEIEKAVIDTNILIYDLIEDSIYHKEASRVLDTLEVWIIPTIVIHEFIWFIKNINTGVNDPYVLILQYINNEKTIVKPVLSHHIRQALNIIHREKISLTRYNDKLILSIALDEKIPIATFDRKLRNQAKRFKIEVIPHQFCC